MCLVHPQESSELKQSHSSLKEQLRIKEEVWNGKGGGGKEEDGGRKRRGRKRHMGVARRSVTCLIVFPPPPPPPPLSGITAAGAGPGSGQGTAEEDRGGVCQ